MRSSDFIGGLVAIAIAGGLAGCSATPAAQPTAPPPPSPVVAPKPGAAPAGPVSVKLADLEGSRREPSDATRNPFRFQPKPVPPPPPRPVTLTPPPAEFRPTPVVPSGPPPLPAIPLKFLGVITRADGVRWAVLSDGKLPIYGRETDIIAGQYLIVSIGTESIELAYADGRGRQTVKLSGQ